jgi:hypothetical protein
VTVSLLALTLSSCTTRKVMTTRSYDLPSGFPSMHALPSDLGISAIRDAARFIPGAELKMYLDAAHEILREADPIRADALATIDEFLGRRAR